MLLHLLFTFMASCANTKTWVSLLTGFSWKDLSETFRMPQTICWQHVESRQLVHRKVSNFTEASWKLLNFSWHSAFALISHKISLRRYLLDFVVVLLPGDMCGASQDNANLVAYLSDFAERFSQNSFTVSTAHPSPTSIPFNKYLWFSVLSLTRLWWNWVFFVIAREASRHEKQFISF